MDFPPIRTPRSVKAATELVERFAALDARLAEVEAERTVKLGEVNAAADVEAAPLLAERSAIRDKLAAWWPGAAAELTAGKRKSIELGGCTIGSRSGKDTLGIEGDEQRIIAALERKDWAKDLLRVKTSLDRPAALKALGGTLGRKLQALGLRRVAGEETFVLERVVQSGTLAGAS